MLPLFCRSDVWAERSLWSEDGRTADTLLSPVLAGLCMRKTDDDHLFIINVVGRAHHMELMSKGKYGIFRSSIV